MLSAAVPKVRREDATPRPGHAPDSPLGEGEPTAELSREVVMTPAARHLALATFCLLFALLAVFPVYFGAA